MLKRISLCCIIIVLHLSGFAWGTLGHRIVGEIADSFLSSKAKKKIKAILGNESVAMSSNWADFVKSDTAYNHLSPWHYVNITGGLDKETFINKLESDTSVNAYTKILFLRDQLKYQVLDNKTKAEYLKLLIHIIGDIHQPMHVGRAEDRGGNSIKLLWFNDNVNLHQIWDDKLINFQQLSYTEYVKAINFTNAEEKKALQKETLTEMFFQSYQIAEKIYADVKQEEKLSYNYNFKYINTVNDQLRKGGIHLAGILNDIFK